MSRSPDEVGHDDVLRRRTVTQRLTRTGVEAVGHRLARMDLDGQPLWFDPVAPKPRTTPLTAHLLPLYDEALLTYPQLNFPTAPGHPHPPDLDLFIGSAPPPPRHRAR